ncbi:MAG: hypothetical protein LBI49_05695 [Nocardiopsaceae bacterium]|nr:hypothetical protein [Nocardiopsaceae bacterium]
MTVSDDAGTPRFEVRNNPGFATMLSLSVAGGEQVATLRRRRGGRFQVLVGGKQAGLVRRRGADGYDIKGALWSLAAAGSVPDGRYSITCNGLPMARVSRQITDDVRPMQTISVDIVDGDPETLLATVLAIEAMRYEHAGTGFNPRALLELLGHVLNPLNWLRLLNPFW